MRRGPGNLLSSHHDSLPAAQKNVAARRVEISRINNIIARVIYRVSDFNDVQYYLLASFCPDICYLKPDVL